MIRIFIDTNKYLDFYRASDHSLVTLNSLISLIESKKIELILPKQVIDEFTRDKDLVFKEFIERNFYQINTPGFLKGNKKISGINNSIDKIKKEYQKKFYSPRSKINVTLKKIFLLANKIEEHVEILQCAYFRTLRRNPPRKDNSSFGDAIIWETLLKNFFDQDIVIISGDGDFSSEIDKNQINPYLKKEWSEHSKKNIRLYTNLGLFINEQSDKKKPIRKETIQEENYLNSIVTSPGHTQLFMSSGLNPNVVSLSGDPFLLGSQQDNYLRGATVNDGYCTCCGEKYSQLSGATAIMGRCNDCSDFLSVGKKCQSCGKHYHDSSTEIYMTFENKCRGCRKNI